MRHFSVFVYEYLENTTNSLRYHTNWLACIVIARISASGLDAASIALGSRKNEDRLPSGGLFQGIVLYERLHET